MISVLIADDHAIVRRGMKQLLLEEYPLATIVEADNAEELIKRAAAKTWDVVICDLNMPGRGGLDALKQIKQTSPKLPVLIMSMYPPEQYAVRAMKAGASGYLGKDAIHDELIEAVRTVLGGRKFITPSLAAILIQKLDTMGDRPTHAVLSDREFEVLKFLASGKSVSEIANKLSLSVTTVSTYRSHILEKMGLRSNVEIARYALENNLIED
jgi:two-component system invasion response regulator UvrY